MVTSTVGCMTDDILKRAEELLGPLHLPLEWDDDYGGIVT